MPAPASQPEPHPDDDETDDQQAPWRPSPWQETPWWRKLLTGVERSPRVALVLAVGVVVVVVALVAGAVVLWPRATASIDDAVPHVDDVAAPPSVTSPDVQVHVAGAVAQPGVYRLPAGGRVADVVEAAGGFTADAAPDRINLAAELRDGSQVYVPRLGEDTPIPDTGGDGGVAADEATIDVNTAGVAELERLPGIGPTLAEAIVRHRDIHGPFSSLDDLTAVSGIGPAKLEALRDSARV